MAGVMWAMLAVSTIFTAGTLGVFAFFFTIPASLIYWQIRYGHLTTVDPDYKKAKRDWLIALLLWLPAALIEIIFIAVRVM